MDVKTLTSSTYVYLTLFFLPPLFLFVYTHFLLSSRPSNTIDVEPQLTLRGHSAAITRLIHSPTKGLLYSASLDSSIRVWALPAPGHTTYAPYDETRARGELIGHTDAVWDLALVRDEATLISAGAEGSVKVWDVSGPSGGGSLKLSWGWNGVQEGGDDNNNNGQGQHHEREEDAIGTTAVEAIKTDLKKVAVAYQNAVVKIFDIETGKETMKLGSDISYGMWPSSSSPFLLLFGVFFGEAQVVDGMRQMRRRQHKSIGWHLIRRCPSW
jgi:striatin 1/3/4